MPQSNPPSSELASPTPIWVNSPESLEQIMPTWCAAKALAIDTEFERTNTFHAIAGLIQISDGREVWFIDPLVLKDLSPLAELFNCESVVKILHSCGEDLGLLLNCVGALPKPLFDTQLAAGFLGYDFSMGYQRLIKECINLDLPKDATRSNWLQRPLSEVQLQYAALDVYYLAEAYLSLYSRLEESGKLDWVLLEGERLVNEQLNPSAFEQYYAQVKMAWKLQAKQLAVLRGLCAWREEECRQRNIPRNHLVKEQVIFDIARLMPQDKQALGRVADIQNRSVNKYGQVLLDIVAAELGDQANYPERLPLPLPPTSKAQSKWIRNFCAERAETLGVAVEVLIRKKHIEALIRSGLDKGTYTLPESLCDWRGEAFAVELLEGLQQHFSRA